MEETEKYTEMESNERLFPFRYQDETIKIIATEETGEKVLNDLQEVVKQ